MVSLAIALLELQVNIDKIAVTNLATLPLYYKQHEGFVHLDNTLGVLKGGT